MSDQSRGPIRPRRAPCASCPYRCGVPSGIWSQEEYEKLPAYDGDIPDQLSRLEQSTRVFLCHQSGQEACAGWLGHRDPGGLLAVRLGVSAGHLDPSCLRYETSVELFGSGAAAAEHGVRGVAAPDEQAQAAIAKIATVRSRTGRPLQQD